MSFIEDIEARNKEGVSSEPDDAVKKTMSNQKAKDPGSAVSVERIRRPIRDNAVEEAGNDNALRISTSAEFKSIRRYHSYRLSSISKR